MRQYKFKKAKVTTIKRNENFYLNGETMITKMRRILSNEEKIKDGVEINYTARNEGVRPEWDIRTDRMEIAMDAMDYRAKTLAAKRTPGMGEEAKKGMEKEADTTTSSSEAASIQATPDKKG